MILERNYLYRGAEIDIIAGKKDLIVFVEVKARVNSNFGSPEESIIYYKQNQIKKAALSYQAKQNGNIDYRFDVISIFIKNKPVINHIENAFN